jgi:hypothetical protein
MFTWNETVAISLISVLGDQGLVIYFMSLLKPMRRDFAVEEAREWHQSLRITQKERWTRIANLSKQRKFSQMNASVPITCTLPFDGGMWRNTRLLLRNIRYFRRNFIRKHIPDGIHFIKSLDEKLSKKIYIVNLINRVPVCVRSGDASEEMREVIDEALNDVISFNDYDYEEGSVAWENDLPYIILVEDESHNNPYISVEN